MVYGHIMKQKKEEKGRKKILAADRV